MSASEAEHLVLRLEGFEGPLDLLLDLARAQKVDLAKISILALVEQYLAVIEGARRIRLELAADWLVMAAWLAWLKSRLLLPEGGDAAEEGEQAADVLAARLRDLSAIRAAALPGWRPGRSLARRCSPVARRRTTRRSTAPGWRWIWDRWCGRICRRCAGGAGTRRYQPRPLSLWSVKDALQRPRRAARQPARLDQPGPVPAGAPSAAPLERRAALASTLLAGLETGARRRRAAAAGAGIRPDPGAARAGRQ